MKQWQVDAIRKIDKAARQAKEDILGMATTANYDSTNGELIVNLVEDHDDDMTLTRPMHYLL